MPEQWMSPSLWGWEQWLVLAMLIILIVAMAGLIYRLIGIVQRAGQPRERPDLRPERHGERHGRQR